MPYANVSLVRLLLQSASLSLHRGPTLPSTQVTRPHYPVQLPCTSLFLYSGTSRYSTWVAQVRVVFSSHGRPFSSLLHRLAFPLRGAHGCRFTVHHGFLRAS
jgi:hypothetical protein